MNIAGVTIADASIDLSVRLKATATGIADGRRHAVESDSELELKAGAGGAWKLPIRHQVPYRNGPFSSIKLRP